MINANRALYKAKNIYAEFFKSQYVCKRWGQSIFGKSKKIS